MSTTLGKMLNLDNPEHHTSFTPHATHSHLTFTPRVRTYHLPLTPHLHITYQFPRHTRLYIATQQHPTHPTFHLTFHPTLHPTHPTFHPTLQTHHTFTPHHTRWLCLASGERAVYVCSGLGPLPNHRASHLIHTSNTHSCLTLTPHIHTTHTHITHSQHLIHTSHFTFTDHIHTSHSHLSFTPLIHTYCSHLSFTPIVHSPTST